MAKAKILFVCPGDASRSLMAKGFARFYAGQMVEVESAGSDPKPPSAYIVWGMNEVSIDISKDTPKALSSLNLDDFDFIVTLSDEGQMSLPRLPAAAKVENWQIPDPGLVRGQTSDLIRAITFIRYQIEDHVQTLLQRVLGTQAKA